MGFFDNITSSISERLPSLRKPEYNSLYESYLDEYAWTLQKRNKTIGIGWDTYYAAGNNVWISACIQAYVDTVTNLDYLIYNPNSETVNTTRVNYLNNLFENPMGLKRNDTYEIFQTLMWKSYLLLGDAFCEVIYDNKFTNIPIGFKHIPTEKLIYYPDTAQWGLIDNSRKFDEDQLIHIKDPDIRGTVWGQSKIDILASDITMEILGQQHTKDLLENKGFDPRGVIEYDTNLPEDEWNRQIKRIQAQATHNRKGTMIIRGGKYTKAANTNQDMEFIEMKKEIRDRIIATYGVPPARVSIIETANLGSGSGLAQDKQFKKTFKGKSKLFEKAYSKVLGRSIFEEIFEYGDLDIQDAKERTDIENIRINNGSKTINEVRQSYGEEPVSWGDNQPNNQRLTLNRKYTNELEKAGLILNKKNY